MRVLFFITFLWFLGPYGFAQEQNQKIDDIDKRLIKLETKVEEGFKSIDKRFESMDSRFSSLESSQQSNFQIVIALIVALMGIMGGFVGFVLWERSNLLKPVNEKISKLELLENRVKNLETKINNLST